MQLSTPMAYDFHSSFMQNITCGAQQKNVSTNEFNCGRLCKDSEVIADTAIESNRNSGHFFPVKKKGDGSDETVVKFYEKLRENIYEMPKKCAKRKWFEAYRVKMKNDSRKGGKSHIRKWKKKICSDHQVLY